MSDEGKLNKQRDRGTRAEALLDNELIKEAFEKIEQECIDRWRDSRPDEDLKRHNAYLLHGLSKNFKQHFVNIVRTGEKAKKDLLQIGEKSKLRRVIGGR